jgi:hypothetical protein
MLSVASHFCSSPSLRGGLVMWFDDPSWLLAVQVLDGVGGGPTSEADCMSWSFPRQVNLPPIRSPREAMPPAPSRSSPLPQRQGRGYRSSGRFRRSVTAFCCSCHQPVRRIASPLWAPASRASQATRGSPDRAEGHRHKVRNCTGASSAWPRLAIDFAALRFFRQRPDPPFKAAA